MVDFVFCAVDMKKEEIQALLRPALEGLARAGDGLIGTHQGPVHAVLEQGVQGGDVGLEGAVGLHRDKAPGGPPSAPPGPDGGKRHGGLHRPPAAGQPV
mgnify:CR=1 FL=1